MERKVQKKRTGTKNIREKRAGTMERKVQKRKIKRGSRKRIKVKRRLLIAGALAAAILLLISTGRMFQISSGRMGKEKQVSKMLWELSAEILSSASAKEAASESQTESNMESPAGGQPESSSWLLPQAAQCLFTEAEKEKLEKDALAAAEQVQAVYQNVEFTNDSPNSSQIRDFTREQRRQAVALLGKAGFVSVTENTNMENYGEVEEFYAAYMEKREAMVTVFEVDLDGRIGATTFLCRDGSLQTYYVGIEWQAKNMPEDTFRPYGKIRETSVSNIAELKLTEKGYLIYAYEDVIAHASLRQCWRVKPLSDKCREFTEKFISGLSYVNYNVLVTNWDRSNAEDILMPCMFEDIYRMDTGEILKAEDGRIPAELYERIMTAYFPVSKEQVREKCGYEESSGSYPYEMIYAVPYPPFGEVVDYTEHEDGSITLFVDGVWADYNSDLAFTNEILVAPFSDGTFRYLSNQIQQKELELPAGGSKILGSGLRLIVYSDL